MQSHLAKHRPQARQTDLQVVLPPQPQLQLRQGQIRLRLNPDCHSFAQFWRELARRTTLAAWRPLDATSLAQRPHQLLGPSQAHRKTFRQHRQTAVATLIGLVKLTTQIVRVGACHRLAQKLSRAPYIISENGLTWTTSLFFYTIWHPGATSGQGSGRRPQAEVP